ncbi:MAG: cation:proton antiporter [Steroidobacteraceae bacterium]
MTYFETLLLILLAAILLLQVTRRLALPYPSVLAVAGVAMGLIPGAPSFAIDPPTALALFIAPALLDAAFDFQFRAVKRLWKPLFALAVVAVLVTTAVVAWIGWRFAGLPLAAAVALGAIVAPPDAAAATASLGNVSLPRRTLAVLKGESLLNDATALLLFGVALSAQGYETDAVRSVGLRLLVAAPGGVVLGIAFAWIYRYIARYVTGTLGGNLLEFVVTFWVWILADRLGLSAVLCVVAFAMTLARIAAPHQRPRVRVHSFAVWDAVVFLLNVLAFLIMGMQARRIIGEMEAQPLQQALRFALIVVVGVIVTRLAIVLFYNFLARRFPTRHGTSEAASLRHSLLVGWSGMRGLVTLATAFALPAAFPQRSLIVLSAFAVVLATLVVQGLTLTPLIRLLGLDRDDTAERELVSARKHMARAALAALQGHDGPEAEATRYFYRVEAEAISDRKQQPVFDRHRELGLIAVRAERAALRALQREMKVGSEAFLVLQEGLDWKELALLSETDSQIEQS